MVITCIIHIILKEKKLLETVMYEASKRLSISLYPKDTSKNFIERFLLLKTKKMQLRQESLNGFLLLKSLVWL